MASSPIPSASSTSLSRFVTIKLDGSNYQKWRNQMVPLLLSQDLMSYVDGSVSAPPQVITRTINGSNMHSLSELILNPEYLLWQEQDRYIISLFHAALHPSVLSEIVSLTTSKAVWDALAEMFDRRSEMESIHMLSLIQNLKKGKFSDSMSLSKVKSINESFSGNQMPVCNKDLVFALNGMGL